MSASDNADKASKNTAENGDEREVQQSPQTHITHVSAGEQSVAVGRDLINSNIYIGAPALAGRLGSAPPRPALILGRDEAIRELKTRIGLYSEDFSHGIQVITAVRGWPGVGKTTIAAEIAHDSEIAAKFSDGVLWTSLGKTPNILSELVAWGRALGTDELMRAQSIAEASAQLAALLRNQRRLLIVDDVWEAEHAKAFIVGGRGCSMLFTTRSKTVAQTVAPTADAVYRLPVLSEEAALELLRRVAPSVVEQHLEHCQKLARELDYLPLALQVAGRLLHTEAEYGLDVSSLLYELREGAKLLESKAPNDLSDVEKETTPTIAALLNRSTERLDAQTRDCFAYLGVFLPEPESFDLAALRSMWQLHDPLPVAKKLVERGLLEPAGNGRFQMHALLIKHARSYLT